MHIYIYLYSLGNLKRPKTNRAERGVGLSKTQNRYYLIGPYYVGPNWRYFDLSGINLGRRKKGHKFHFKIEKRRYFF